MKKLFKEPVRIGIIAGTGVYEIKEIKKVREVSVRTPFGRPSDKICIGTIGGVLCAFLPRHGKGHRFLPSEINQRANIYAFKLLGVEQVLSFAAVGSLREDLPPGCFFLPDQLVNETKGRPASFFGNGVAGHVALAEPFCNRLGNAIFEIARGMALNPAKGGTYVCMEGPQFSTKAESEYHRRQGYSIIGMTAVPEANLAREAQMCYCTVTTVTDYDCWKEGSEVSTGEIMKTLAANVENTRRLILKAVPEVARMDRNCPCKSALKGAIVTNPKALNRRTYNNLKPLIEQ